MADAIDLASGRLTEQATQLQTLDRLSQRFGQSLNQAMTAGTASGTELAGTLDRVAASLESVLAKSLGKTTSSLVETGLKDITRSFSKSLLAESFGGELGFARGGVFSGGGVTPFAEGGVVASPTYFPLSGGLGLMGERGPEAIVPLQRGPDGRLGVQSAGGGRDANVTVNITASDAESFRRSEAQVSAALARAVARGRRAL